MLSWLLAAVVASAGPVETESGGCRVERVLGPDGTGYNQVYGVSPDGRRFAIGVYDERPDGTVDKRAFILDLESGARTPLPVLNNAASFSPDGRKLVSAFYTGHPVLETEIVEYDLESQTMRLLSPASGGDWLPTYAPDGRSVVFNSFRHGQSELYRVDLETLRTTRLTEDPAYDAQATVAADGETVLFHRQIGEGDFAVARRAADGTVTLLTDWPGEESYPALSPDGRWIAFSSDRESGAPGANDLWLMRADGAAARRLTAHPANDAYAVWAPDGRSVFYSAQREGSAILYRVAVEDGDCLRA